jgi:hypothetical protein
VRWKFPWVGRRAAGGFDVFYRVSTGAPATPIVCFGSREWVHRERRSDARARVAKSKL